MGIWMSNSQVERESMASGNEAKGVDEDEEPKLGHSLPKIDESRLFELLCALQQISKLQEEAANAQIDARQKMREVGFKRQRVWSSDAAFMRAIQGLAARGRLEGFQELMRLAADCQSARDGLGPLEQEGIEAEQHWEGIIWKLRQAEQSVYQAFKYEFQSSKSYPPPKGDGSSPCESSSETDSQNNGGDSRQVIYLNHRTGHSVASSSSYTLAHSTHEPISQEDIEMSPNITLLGMGETADLQQQTEIDIHAWDSDSGLGDIDRLPEMEVELTGPAHIFPRGPHPSIELYPHLLTDFSSRRDRINKWLQHTTLLSRFDATLLRDQLALENSTTPSNWSQLVVAYWELDGAAKPGSQQAPKLNTTLQADTVQIPLSNGLSPPIDSNVTIPSEAVKPKLWSPASSNPDHGYFSDFRVGTKEGLKSFMVPLRPAPRRPQHRSKSDVGLKHTHEVPSNPDTP